MVLESITYIFECSEFVRTNHSSLLGIHACRLFCVCSTHLGEGVGSDGGLVCQTLARAANLANCKSERSAVAVVATI